MKNLSLEVKVGLFAAIMIVLMAWATLRVSDKSSVSGGGYNITAVFDNATGLKKKAPVELAGVKVGVVKDVELLNSRQAEVVISIDKNVKLTEDSQAVLRTRGFLGETYVEIIPGDPEFPIIKNDGSIPFTARTGDVNSLVSQFSSIADDIKHVTSSLKGMVGTNDSYPVNRIIENLESFTLAIKNVTLRNEENIDRVAVNLAEMTDQLREIIAKGKADVEESAERIASITRKIDEGKGTIGRLVNDDETVDKLNEAVDNLNETLGGFRKLQTEIGYHTEYLGQTHDFKHYVDLALRPAPDKALLLGIVTDPDPRPSHVEHVTDVTVGNNTTTVTTETATIDREKIRFSAQLAKKFYDLQLRGGIIESTGGFGLDFFKGPVAVHFSAFDFSTRFGERPHLKAGADLSIFPNLYLSGGVDDIINKEGPTPDWFVGAGFRFVDDDIKRFMGSGATSLISK
ncbi:MAG: MCE family protein [Deltaproteobacteria bacterium]|nr:MCE family protein [Deltaproteobacteria bacterium]